ncbi:Acyl-coenzyme A diphosphatase SCS3 [Nakaseomyces bracarensis]|uniref:Acyl-coenzyme A diphosphatase SCS3 n=1 Tax=Nakaseomyces bracarensis TaxID=273131 RepID=A0ABR4NPU2_9SACH
MLERNSIYKWALLGLCPAILILGNLLSLFVLREPWEINKDGIINSIFVKKGWFWTTLVGWLCIVRYDTRQLWKTSLKRYLILTVWWYVFTQGILWFDLPPIMDLIFKFSGGSCNFDLYDSDGNVNLEFQDSWRRRLSSWRKIYNKVKDYQVNGKNPLGVDSKMMEFVTGSIEKALDHYGQQIRKSTVIREVNKFLMENNLDYSNRQINQFIKDFIANISLNTTSGTNSTLDNSSACRINGGYWKGGHDPSGHIFLLTLMILFLIGESRQFFFKAIQHCLSTKSYCIDQCKKIISAPPQDNRTPVWEQRIQKAIKLTVFLARYILWENPIILLVVLLALWLWNLILTVIVFHTFSEQLSGLFFAYIVAATLYYLD